MTLRLGWKVRYGMHTLKGPVHQLYMYVLIKGHCRCDQNAIGLVTFESQGKEKSAYLFSKISKIRCPIPNLGAPIPNLGAPTLNFCAHTLNLGAPTQNFGASFPLYRVPL